MAEHPRLSDNGYGDVKTVVLAINTYERLGAQAVFFEDQISPKRCEHLHGRRLLSTEQMDANIRAAAGNRINPDTFIAPTDAREVYDLDEALRRGEGYVRAGADGLFIEAPVNIDELDKIGRAFEVPQLANMLEGGRTPVLTPAELEQMGFRIAIYGISLLMHAVRAMQNILAGLARGELISPARASDLKNTNQLWVSSIGLRLKRNINFRQVPVSLPKAD